MLACLIIPWPLVLNQLQISLVWVSKQHSCQIHLLPIAVRCFFELGGFPDNTILAEDMYLTAKMIKAGYKVAYCAEAAVKHSHNYTPWEEFRRYFDTGVFHASEPWIREQFGGAEGEGMRFIRSELFYLWQNAPYWIPRALLTIGCKALGYKLGLHFRKLPWNLRHKLGMYKAYWLQNRN